MISKVLSYVMLLFVGTSNLWGAEGTPVPVSPGLVDDTGVAVVGYGCPTFSWGAVQGARSYEVAVFELLTVDVLPYEEMLTLSFSEMRTHIPAPALSWTPSSAQCPMPEGVYVWYVSGKDETGEGSWSLGKVFEIDMSVVSEEMEDAATRAVESYMDRHYVVTEVSGVKDPKHAVTVKRRVKRVEESGSADRAATARDETLAEMLRAVKVTASERQGDDTVGQPAKSGGSGLTVLSGNVGFGTASPSQQLEITKSLEMPWTTDSSTGVIYKGGFRFIHDFKASGTVGGNLFVGKAAGNFTMGGDSAGDGSDNTGIGEGALADNTSGHDNTAIGAVALSYNTTGESNSASGAAALFFNTTGSANTAVGADALLFNTTGSYNVGVGALANLFNQGGSNNTLIGYAAGQGGTDTVYHDKSGNVFIGYKAGFFETGDNKLYIENSDSSAPLIGGDFSADEIYLNAKVGIGTSTPRAVLDLQGDFLFSGGSLGTDTSLRMNDVIHNTIPSDLWIGQVDNYLQSCDSSGACINHGRKGDAGKDIWSTAVFNGKLWLGQSAGALWSCDNAADCVYHGDKGDGIYAMAVFNGKLWIGQSGGTLQSCDNSGVCTNHGSMIDSIYTMSVYHGRLWLGQNNGKLRSCFDSGECIDHGSKGDNIYSMAVFDGMLWIGQEFGGLQSCDNAGACIDQGDKGDTIWSMAVFNGELWIGQNDGKLQSCEDSGVCTDHGDKGESIDALAVFSGELWIGQNNGFIQSCASLGVCTSKADLSEGINALAAFAPASLGNTLHVNSGRVGIGTTAPDDALDVVGDIDATGCVKTDNSSVIGGTCVSDHRLKIKIRRLDGSLPMLSRLKPVRYDWNQQGRTVYNQKGPGVGLIAQEVEEVFPHLVKVGSDGRKRVRYDLELQMHMIQAIKELKALNDALRTIVCRDHPEEALCTP